MKYFLDSAKMDEIKEAYNTFGIDGVTTNPSILSKVKGDPIEVLKEIRTVLGEEK